jgi:hypothetical protein
MHRYSPCLPSGMMSYVQSSHIYRQFSSDPLHDRKLALSPYKHIFMKIRDLTPDESLSENYIYKVFDI